VPIYEFRCPNGHTFEVFQKMTEPPPATCPTCAAGPVEKILFPVAVHFKGSGFYSTDYGKGARKAAAKDGDGTTGGEKKAEKAESKAADKPSGGDTSSGDKKASAD
jgi:putative FmdB family regulatory protein